MRKYRFFLQPFGLLYGLAIRFRNLLYDTGIKKETDYNFPVIGIGNLTTGGTGKTPHTLYIARLLSTQFPIAILSRGYGRKTKGFRVVNVDDHPENTGDEPLMMKKREPDLLFVVDEKRTRGIDTLMESHPETKAVILDDVFQHRKVKPYPLILLTEYDRLFTKDHLLPAGNLREPKSSYRRADIIIITKTPAIFSPLDKRLLLESISPRPHQKVFFSYLTYGQFISFKKPQGNIVFPKEYYFERKFSVVLVTGIANPTPLYEYLTMSGLKVTHLDFPDHHPFTSSDLSQIKSTYDAIAGENKMIVTTEKDYIRLIVPELEKEVSQLPFYYLPADTNFHDHENFDQTILRYVG